MENLVSIIIPVFNTEDYLHRCIDSVLNQTYTNLEIILVDDGSWDNGGKICDEYAKIDKRIKVIHKKNGGSSDARNVGLENTTGEYISFVDSDDFVHKSYIEVLYKLLKESDADMAVCGFITSFKKQTFKEITFEYSNVEALNEIHNKIYTMPWGKLYKRYLFDGIHFPVGKVHEDEFITYKLLYKAKKVVLTTKQLLYWYRRKGSVTSAGLTINDYLEAFLEEANFFREIGLNELSEKTCKLAFSACLFAPKKNDKPKNSAYLKEYYKNLKELRKCLRKSNQKIRCRIFYEIYFSAPRVMDFFHYVYKKWKS